MRRPLAQIRIKLDDVCGVLSELVDEKRTWEDVYAKYPHQAVKDDDGGSSAALAGAASADSK